MNNQFENRSFSNANEGNEEHKKQDDVSSLDIDQDKDLLEGLGRQLSSNNNLNVETNTEEKTHNEEKKTNKVVSSSDVPYMFRNSPDLIKDMYRAGIDFHINQLGEVVIKDFYRPSTMVMTVDEDDNFTIELKKDLLIIENISDLTDLNYKEWKKTGKGKGNYASPAKCWADLFAEKGLAKRQMVFVPVDED